MNIKEKALKLKKDIPAVFLSLKDKRTPLYAKVMAFLTVAYALSPIDLIPDFIPVLGYLDDLVILPSMVMITVKLIPEEVFKENEIKAENIWINGKPKKWYYAIPIVIIWVLIISIIFIAIRKKYM